jgi:formate hydrogenlyase subunit 4
MTAASFVPIAARAPIVAFNGDLILFAALLACGRFFLTLGGLDTGSSFEGMGVSRELTMASLVEPALFLCFITLVLATHSLSLAGMLGAPLLQAWSASPVSLVLLVAALTILLLAEVCRGPVDDPATHLELTMIHEVMVLDCAGPDLGLILYAGALRFALFAVVISDIFWPRAALSAPWQVAGLVVGLLAVAILVGLIESIMARLRLLLLPQLLVSASILGALGCLLLLR